MPFSGEKYVIQRLNKDETACIVPLEGQKDFTFDKIILTSGCYNVRKLGTKYLSFTNEACDEYWEKSDTVWSLTNITCKGMQTVTFAPDGNFQLARIDGDLSDVPKSGTKDSLVISVGQCSTIKQ